MHGLVPCNSFAYAYAFTYSLWAHGHPDGKTSINRDHGSWHILVLVLVHIQYCEYTKPMSRSNESSRGQDVPGDVKDAFESLEKKLDAGLADLMADEGNSRTDDDDDDDGDDGDDGDDTANDSLVALAAADDAAREAEAMARSMAEEAATFAATVASTTVDDDATSAEERIEMTRLSQRNEEEAELLQQKAALAASARQKAKGKSPKQISILLLGLIGLILALGVGSVFHRTRSTRPEANEHDDSTQTLFDIIKEWNVKHEKEERYNEAMRNMLNPRREDTKDAGEQHNAHQEEHKETIPHDHEEQQYLIAGDGQMAKLINAMYQPVYYVTYRPVQRLRYYYYHQTPSHRQEEVVVRQSRSGGAVTYRKAKVVQNVHHNRSF